MAKNGHLMQSDGGVTVPGRQKPADCPSLHVLVFPMDKEAVCLSEHTALLSSTFHAIPNLADFFSLEDSKPRSLEHSDLFSYTSYGAVDGAFPCCTPARGPSMKHPPPPPIAKAFLVCRDIDYGSSEQEEALVGLPRFFAAQHFPAGTTLGFFARCTSAHGEYRVEVQLQTMDGTVVWRDGPPEAWRLDDPLELYDLLLKLTVVFPKPGNFALVLTANGEEIAR